VASSPCASLATNVAGHTTVELDCFDVVEPANVVVVVVVVVVPG
jgi:hypothetical protein